MKRLSKLAVQEKPRGWCAQLLSGLVLSVVVMRRERIKAPETLRRARLVVN